MQNKRAFTLIELLVVVLIIGILAAVALPQYQRAVWKSRLGTVKTLVSQLIQAEEVFYLANNSYTTDIENLDISLPITTSQNVTSDTAIYTYDWGRCRIRLIGNNSVDCALYHQGELFVEYHQKLTHSIIMANRKICMAYGSSSKAANTLAQQVCKSDTGKKDLSDNTNCGDNYCFWYY